MNLPHSQAANAIKTDMTSDNTMIGQKNSTGIKKDNNTQAVMKRVLSIFN
jgi:hypothetical protein